MSGIFNLLPLGLRVQNKIEALIDKHMRAIGIHHCEDVSGDPTDKTRRFADSVVEHRACEALGG